MRRLWWFALLLAFCALAPAAASAHTHAAAAQAPAPVSTAHHGHQAAVADIALAVATSCETIAPGDGPTPCSNHVHASGGCFCAGATAAITGSAMTLHPATCPIAPSSALPRLDATALAPPVPPPRV